MQKHLSVQKRTRQSENRRLRNKSIKSNLRTTIKKVSSAIMNKNQEEAGTALKEAIPTIDKAVSKGIIHKNNAARKKSRLMRKINALVPSN